MELEYIKMNKGKKLTVIILTKNEESNIRKSICSVLGLANEIMIVDDFSTDNTTKIAKSLGAKIYKRKLLGNFADQRNFGLEAAKGEYVLFLDADECLSAALKKEIRRVLHENVTCSGYLIKRTDVAWGKKMLYGEVGSIKLVRLGTRKAGIWKREVHEVWDINGQPGNLNGEIIHYPHKNLSCFLSSIGNFSSIHAVANNKEGKKSSLLKIMFWPLIKLMYFWVVRKGFADGVRGYIYAVMMSFHSFLSWSLLWQMQKESK